MNKTIFKCYVEDINRYPLLTAEQEKDLSKKILAGDMNAKQFLVNSNLRFVISVAKKLSSNDAYLMDFIQEGNVGLMYAASRYDYNFNTRFSTYAYFWISEYISRYKKKSDKSISIPIKVQDRMKLIASARALLWEKLERNPSDQELSVYTGMLESEICELSQFNYIIKSFDFFGDNDTDTDFSILDFLSDNRPNPEDEILVHVEQEEILKMINSLKERERIVLEQRYNGFKSGTKNTYKSISDLIGTSVEGTRQIENRANIKMQAMYNAYCKKVSIHSF